MRAFAAEFIGTFFLVFVGCGAIATGLDRTSTALAFGLVVAVMVYALGHISGAHLNPAVSIGFAVGSHLPWTTVATYSVAQIAGAVAGAETLRLTLGSDADLGVTRPSGTIEQALVWEGLLSFALMLVITAVATGTRAVRHVAALAIGGTVALAALVGGPISGASMNPARSLGPALVSGDLDSIWVYIIGPVVGTLSAAWVYRLLRVEARSADPITRDFDRDRASPPPTPGDEAT